MRYIDQRKAVGSNLTGRLRQHLLQRAQHQGQRRPELVADVGKEQRLGTVDLSQRLSTTPLVFVRLCVGETSGYFPGRECEKVSVSLIELAERI